MSIVLMKILSLRAKRSNRILRDCFVNLLLAITPFVLGCQSTHPKPKETPAEQISAISTMTQGLTNQPITDEKLKDLAKQVSKDPDAQSAIRSINTALSPVHTVKFCPEDGQRYSPEMEYCPDHKVKLEWVE